MLIKRTKLILFLLLFSFSLNAFTALGSEYYAGSSYLTFQNHCYLNFGQPAAFASLPQKGLPIDSSLVGLWNMSEPAGGMISDVTKNSTNLTISGPTLVDTNNTKALMFDGKNDYLTASDCASLHQPLLTISAKLQLGRSGVTQTILDKGVNSGGSNNWLLRITSSDKLQLIIGGTASMGPGSLIGNSALSVNTDYQITAVISETQLSLYINGFLDNTQSRQNNITYTNTPLTIGNRPLVSSYFQGIIYQASIYNRALPSNEILSLYKINDKLNLFSDYYSFKDAVTNNTLLINVESSKAQIDNPVLITCNNFFEDKKLLFQANNTATVTIWTNLGQPAFITNGVWNENYTTTLMLDASSTGELNWKPGTPPSASNLSTTSTTAGNTTRFSDLWSDNQTLSGGGYVFSTNNTGRWVNASWVAFASNPDWGNVTLTLNSTVGAVVGFREYANNSLNLWGASEIYNITTTAPTDTPTPAPTPASTPTPTPASTPTPTQTNPFPTETILIAATAIAVLVAVFALALKKGYIKIETVDEDSSEGGA